MDAWLDNINRHNYPTLIEQCKSGQPFFRCRSHLSRLLQGSLGKPSPCAGERTLTTVTVPFLPRRSATVKRLRLCVSAPAGSSAWINAHVHGPRGVFFITRGVKNV